MTQTLTSNLVSFETKQHVMQRAISQCPAVPTDLLGQKVPSLLDSGSMVMLIHEGYFTKNILPLLQKPVRDLTEAHSLFWLSAMNNEVMLVSKYFEANVTIHGFKVPQVGFLVVKDPNALLEPQYSTQLPGVIGCNLIWLGCDEFRRVHGFDAFEEFPCLSSIHPVVFAQLCLFYHQSKLLNKTQAKTEVSTSSIQTTTSETSSSEAKKRKDCSSSLEKTFGQVWVGSIHEAICIPANSAKVLQGKTEKMTHHLTCMVKARAVNNLPIGLVVNRTMVTLNKNKKVPVAIV